MTTILSVGSPYPFPLKNQGANANFLTLSGNALQISIHGITKEELFSLKKGNIKAGFMYKNGDMLWLFTFHDKKGKVFTLDCPFDVRLIPKNLLALHSITNSKQRLVIDIHVVDENKTVRALRSVTLSNELTIQFLSAAQDQIIEPNKSGLMLDQWMNETPDQLTKKTKMYLLGK